MLGNPATHSVDDARMEANRLKGQAAAGGDPAADRRAAAAAARHSRSNTLFRLAESYARALPKRPKMRGAGLPSAGYVAEELTQVQLALSAMEAEELAAADLTEANLRQLLDETAGKGSIAGKRFGALSRFLDWAQDAGHITSNPCALIARARRPKAPQPRGHYLTSADLGQLWRAAESMEQPVHRDLTRFLIAIPCRRAEAANLDWSHLNLTAAEWRQPGKMTKNREAHRLFLHPLALSILLGRYTSAGSPRAGLVFVAPRSGGAVTTFNEMKASLSRKSGVSGWNWHDFRRSFATALGESGIPETVADAVLNHRQSATRGGVLGVYQRATRWPEQVQAMELWGRLLADAIEGRETDAKVIPLAARAG
jgi:integrase